MVGEAVVHSCYGYGKATAFNSLYHIITHYPVEVDGYKRINELSFGDPTKEVKAHEKERYAEMNPTE